MQKIIINPQYKQLEEFVENIPHIFESEGESIYKGRNQVKVFKTANILINVKSFKTPNIINQIAYTNIRASKAKRSYEYGLELMKNDINTPTPIAYIEEKEGFTLKSSFYISIHEEVDNNLRILREADIDNVHDLLHQFALFAAKLHDKNILHIDFSPGNILFKKNDDTYTFYLVDLNRMVFGKEITRKKGCKNLEKLYGSDEMIKIIAKEYAIARNFDISESQELVLQYHSKFWKKLLKRHPNYNPPYIYPTK